jgi:uncharacterized protein YbaR (Trm112 family)
MTRDTESSGPLPLVCPRDKMAFSLVTDSSLTCPAGHRYPIVRGIPVFLIAEASETREESRHLSRPLLDAVGTEANLYHAHRSEQYSR